MQKPPFTVPHTSQADPVAWTVSVTPRFDELTPRFDVVVVQWRWAGVTGPFVATELDTLDDLEKWLAGFGLTQVSEFSPVDGFADANLEKV